MKRALHQYGNDGLIVFIRNMQQYLALALDHSNLVLTFAKVNRGRKEPEVQQQQSDMQYITLYIVVVKLTPHAIHLYLCALLYRGGSSPAPASARATIFALAL